MIKDILLNLSVGVDRDPAAEFAISVARAFDARVRAIAFAYELAVPPLIGVGHAMRPEWATAQKTKGACDAKAAIARFDEAARRAGLSAESRTVAATFGGAPELFARLARRYDISVVRQADADRPYHEEFIIHAALFDSGRPVLIVLYVQTDGLALNQVMVCWDGSRSAARAIADAMPFLTRAGRVEIFTVAANLRRNEIPAADIARHLARHGLTVEAERVVASDIDLPNAILSHAADTSCNLIVMGGYVTPDCASSYLEARPAAFWKR
jgi:nucleotide-binding universal stress UspA family protein